MNLVNDIILNSVLSLYIETILENVFGSEKHRKHAVYLIKELKVEM